MRQLLMVVLVILMMPFTGRAYAFLYKLGLWLLTRGKTNEES